MVQHIRRRGLALSIYLWLLTLVWGALLFAMLAAALGVGAEPELWGYVLLAFVMLLLLTGVWYWQRWAATGLVFAYAGASVWTLSTGQVFEGATQAILAALSFWVFRGSWDQFGDDLGLAGRPTASTQATDAPAGSPRPTSGPSHTPEGCPSCGAEANAQARFCDQCGSPLRCGNCGASLGPRSKFCDQCGTTLTRGR